jgi:hypothetical protein
MLVCMHSLLVVYSLVCMLYCEEIIYYMTVCIVIISFCVILKLRDELDISNLMLVPLLDCVRNCVSSSLA